MENTKVKNNILNENTPQINNYPQSKKRGAVDIIIWTIVGIIGIIIVAILFMLILGYRPAVVLTGSMEPTITPGDMIVYKAISEEDIKVGDIVTFYMTQEAMDNHAITYTHRVINIENDSAGQVLFQMQGDANETPDFNLIPIERIIGKVNFIVPWVGQMFLFVKNNLLFVVGTILSLLLVGYLISRLIKEIKSSKKFKIEK